MTTHRPRWSAYGLCNVWFAISLAMFLASPDALPADETPPKTGSSAAVHSADVVVMALLDALDSNREHCRHWLADHDFKSFNRGVVGIAILADILAAKRDDDAWKAGSIPLISAVRSLEESGKKRDAAAAETALKSVAAAAAELKKLSPGKTATAPVKPRGGFRNLMYLLEGTLADAKTSLATRDGENAKKSALVLSELGRIVSNEKSDPKWKQWSDDFLAATRAAAEANNDDELRPLFHVISRRCEACHEKK